MSILRPRSSAPVVYGGTDMTDYNDRLHAASVRQDTPVGDPPVRTHHQSNDADHQLNVDIEKLDHFLRDTNLETLGQELQTIFRRYQPIHSRSDIIRRLPQAVRKVPLGVESIEDEEEWIETARKIREDVKRGQWTPLGGRGSHGLSKIGVT